MDRSPHPPRLDRRTLAAGLALGAALPAAAWAQAGGRRRATPAQTEGPFYPPSLPADHDADLLRSGELAYTRGEPVWLEGQLTDLDGRPLRAAQVEIWQCDAAGHYHHPGDRGRADPAFQGFGRASTDGEGRYRFRTLRPVPYTGRTPHIHVKVRLGGRTLLTTQVYVQGEPGNERDFLWRSLRDETDRAALTRPFEPGPDGLRAWFPITVAA